MASQLSDQSKVSLRSQKVLENVALKSTSKIYRLGGIFDDEDIRSIWNAFGLYISRQLRSGRAIGVPGFGNFNFSAPEYKLEGCSNPWVRDKQLRQPVFIISKEFVLGKGIKSGIAQLGGGGTQIRPYSVFSQNGKMPQAKINYTEIGIYCQKSKEEAKLGVERVLKHLAEEARQVLYNGKSSTDMEIPNVGVFRVRGDIAAVTFNEFLMRDAKIISDANKQLKERKQKGEMILTRETIQHFTNFKQMEDDLKDQSDDILDIDPNARTFLKRDLNIDIENIQSNKSFGLIRPQTDMGCRRSLKNFPAPQTTIQRQQLQTLNRGQISFSHDRFQKINTDFGLMELKSWIRKKQLSSEDAFFEFCQVAVKQQSKKVKLTQDNLYFGMKNLNLNVTPVQVTELHRILDFNKDGYIDYYDWMNVIQEEGNPYLGAFREKVRAKYVGSDQFLQSMGLVKGQKSINLIALKDALKKLDDELGDIKAFSIARFIIKEQEFAEIDKILEAFGYLQDSQNEIAGNQLWIQNMFSRFAAALSDQLIFQQFKKQIEIEDFEKQGVISPSSLQKCCLSAGLNFTSNEIQRFARGLQKDQQSGLIQYTPFIEQLQSNIQQYQSTTTVNGRVFRDVADFAAKFKVFYDKNNIKSNDEFIQKALQTIKVSELKLQAFISFLQEYAFPICSEEDVAKYARLVDIDKDGIISADDIETFFNRQNYIIQSWEQQSSSMLGNRQSVSQLLNISQSMKNLQKSQAQKQLFPVKPLDEKEIEVILRELRQVLYSKKKSVYDFFKLLDQNEDGFITINEFAQNIDKIIKYSQQVKDGLFAFMDQSKLGMIDYKTFVRVMDLGAIDLHQMKEERELAEKGCKKEDISEWAQEIIFKIKKWFSEQTLSVEDAFRVFDKDFDGFINKNDIQHFLIDVLHQDPKDIDQFMINRLFKLMDQYKRGMIELTDLRRILCDDLQQQPINSTQSESQDILQNSVAGQKNNNQLSNFDWRSNAKQQIGIVLSRKFNSLKDSFDQISGNSNRLLYQKFENWINQSEALIGFDVSNDLILRVFSDIDPHKKGYLTFTDWENNFSQYHWQIQMIKEVQETLKTHFSSKQEAYKFFSNGSVDKEVTQDLFVKGFRDLFLQRFSREDINNLWIKLSENGVLTFKAFCFFYEDTQQLQNVKKQNSSLPRTQTAPNNFRKKMTDSNVLQQEEAKLTISEHQAQLDDESSIILQKVKNCLRTASKSIEEVFQIYDINQSGKISNLEFRQAFRNLSIGLSAKEIDQLLNMCDKAGDGVVDWKDFIKKFKLGASQIQILERSNQRLKKINDNLHYYMLSPKDAYRLFNEDRSGKMNYTEFYKLMEKLHQLANETLPSFNILKDIFQILDIRQEGKISLQDWIHTFKQFKPPDSSMQGRPVHQELQEIIDSNLPNKRPMTTNATTRESQQLQQSGHLIESSKEFDQIMQAIGRNRKYLLELFSQISKKQTITYNMAKQVLEKLLRSVGIVINDSCYPLLIKFAERDGIVDYQYMLEVYKERMGRISLPPATFTVQKDQNQ